ADARVLGDALHRALAELEAPVLGDVVVAARARAAQRGARGAVLGLYNLLGDPALTVKRAAAPAGELSPDLVCGSRDPDAPAPAPEPALPAGCGCRAGGDSTGALVAIFALACILGPARRRRP